MCLFVSNEVSQEFVNSTKYLGLNSEIPEIRLLFTCFWNVHGVLCMLMDLAQSWYLL